MLELIINSLKYMLSNKIVTTLIGSYAVKLLTTNVVRSLGWYKSMELANTTKPNISFLSNGIGEIATPNLTLVEQNLGTLGLGGIALSKSKAIGMYLSTYLNKYLNMQDVSLYIGKNISSVMDPTLIGKLGLISILGYIGFKSYGCGVKNLTDADNMRQYYELKTVFKHNNPNLFSDNLELVNQTLASMPSEVKQQYYELCVRQSMAQNIMSQNEQRGHYIDQFYLPGFIKHIVNFTYDYVGLFIIIGVLVYIYKKHKQEITDINEKQQSLISKMTDEIEMKLHTLNIKDVEQIKEIKKLVLLDKLKELGFNATVEGKKLIQQISEL